MRKLREIESFVTAESLERVCRHCQRPVKGHEIVREETTKHEVGAHWSLVNDLEQVCVQFVDTYNVEQSLFGTPKLPELASVVTEEEKTMACPLCSYPISSHRLRYDNWQAKTADGKYTTSHDYVAVAGFHRGQDRYCFSGWNLDKALEAMRERLDS